MTDFSFEYIAFANESKFDLAVRRTSSDDRGHYLHLALVGEDGKEALVPLPIQVDRLPFPGPADILFAYQTAAILARAGHDFGTAPDPASSSSDATATLEALGEFLGPDACDHFLTRVGAAEALVSNLDGLPRRGM